jgi:hypothetical protein
MSKLIIVVPAGRRAAGRAVLLGSDGKPRLPPFRVLATASTTAATRRGNPSRDWRRPFGDTPTGSYVVAGALPPGARSADVTEPVGALVLAPVGGNALEALRAGRTRFLVHGGRPDGEGRLRSTLGGVRVSNKDLEALLAAINQANAEGDAVSSVEVEETSTPPWKEGSLDDVPSSREPSSGSSRSRRGARAASNAVSREARGSFGFGPKKRGAIAVGRRAFVGLALFTFGLVAFGCGGTDGIGGASGAGDDGGGVGGGYDGGMPDADAGPVTNPDAGEGTGTHGGTTGEGGTYDGTTTGTTTSEGPTTTGTTTGTTTSEGPTTTGTDTTTNIPVTTGTDTVTTGTDVVTTGTDVVTTGTDVVTTGTDTVTTGTDTVTAGTDTVTTGTDTTTTGTDTTTTGTDTTTTGTDTTTTGTDTTTTGTDTTTTGTDFGFHRPRPQRPTRGRTPSGEGTGL